MRLNLVVVGSDEKAGFGYHAIAHGVSYVVDDSTTFDNGGKSRSNCRASI